MFSFLYAIGGLISLCFSIEFDSLLNSISKYNVEKPYLKRCPGVSSGYTVSVRKPSDSILRDGYRVTK